MMNLSMQPVARRLAVCAVLLVAADAAWAAPVALSTPTGLSSGDRFRFLFVTSGTTTSTSSDIATYDAFVQSEAGGATYNGVTLNWKAIGSTATVDARDHVGGFGSTVGVYLPSGIAVASSMTTSSGGLWSSSLLTAPNQLIDGTASTGRVWTGSNPSGVATSLPLGASAGSSSWAERIYQDNRWLLINPFTSTNTYGMYGLSDELTAAPSVPEIDPAGWATVVALVSSALGLVERRRGKRS